MQTNLCIADLLFCCFCELQHKLRDRKTVRLMNNLVTLDLPANRARTAALQNFKNTCYVNHTLFQ